MGDIAIEDWMAQNVYDPAGDTCGEGETCVLWDTIQKQTCQICDVADATTLDYFQQYAQTSYAEDNTFKITIMNIRKYTTDSNFVEGDPVQFICLNARFIVNSAGAIAASMAMLY